jgi:hypothetical protein
LCGYWHVLRTVGGWPYLFRSTRTCKFSDCFQRPFLCGLATYDILSHHAHKKKHDADHLKYSCDVCQKRFPIRSKLHRHMKTAKHIENCKVKNLPVDTIQLAMTLSSETVAQPNAKNVTFSIRLIFQIQDGVDCFSGIYISFIICCFIHLIFKTYDYHAPLWIWEIYHNWEKGTFLGFFVSNLAVSKFTFQ